MNRPHWFNIKIVRNGALYNNPYFSDVTLIIKENDNAGVTMVINAHKAVLGSVSTYFRTMFDSTFLESRQKEIVIVVPNAKAFDLLIREIYQVDFPEHITWKELLWYYKLAEMYAMNITFNDIYCRSAPKMSKDDSIDDLLDYIELMILLISHSGSTSYAIDLFNVINSRHEQGSYERVLTLSHETILYITCCLGKENKTTFIMGLIRAGHTIKHVNMEKLYKLVATIKRPKKGNSVYYDLRKLNVPEQYIQHLFR